MKILVAGASGATGKLVVAELLNRGAEVCALLRSPVKMPKEILSNEKLTVIAGSIQKIGKKEMESYLKGCDAAVSCLGHNLTLRGIFGPPYGLVTQACKKICNTYEDSESNKVLRFILMNTAGHINGDKSEKVPALQKLMLMVIRLLLPPQRDNDGAAEYLRTKIGQQHSKVEWAAVRPDSLVDQDDVTPYSVFPSPIRSALFNPGQTSRINVAHFMAELIYDDELWRNWKGRMPVIYNESPKK